MKILIASGGSGGHIFPALAFVRELACKDVKIIFAASKRQLDKRLLEAIPCKKVFLSANPMPYKFGFKTIVFLTKLAADSIRSLWLLIWEKPDIAVGFGGYTAGAVMLMARAMGIKTLIHEQNLIPGRTNKFLDKFVDRIAVSFNDTKKYLNNKNVIFTGNPLRKESLLNCRSDAFKKFKLNPEKVTILVMGGSQGAASLNAKALEAAASLTMEEREKIQILHITGDNMREMVKEFYKKNSITGSVHAF
ncbi:MAG: glycosyltransferase, partial [Candidatus Omnitrophota bacterium]